MLGSSIFFPVLRERNFSMNIIVDVMSHTSEFTQPPRDQGDAMISGTRYPSPTGLVRELSGLKPSLISSSIVTNSPVTSSPGETLPFSELCGLGATNGGM